MAAVAAKEIEMIEEIFEGAQELQVLQQNYQIY